MARWSTTTIGDACTLTSGGTPSKANRSFWQGDIPWVSAKDLKRDRISDAEMHISKLAVEHSATRVAPVGSLLMLVRGMGLANGAQIGEVTSPVAFNQDIRAIHPPADLNPRFLLLALRNELNQPGNDVLSSAAHGTLKIDTDALKAVRFPIPPLGEQRRIVAILDEAFEGIATAKANAEKNIESARAVFESELASVFSDLWANTPLGTLSDLATEITDGDHLPPPKAASGVPFITIGNIVKTTREIDFSDTFLVPRSYFEALKASKRPRKGDVLYTVTGSFGIPVIVDGLTEFCFQRHIGLVRPKPDTLPKWLYFLLLSPQVQKQADEGATGAAQRTVSLKLLRSFVVPRPSTKRQTDIASALDRLSRETETLVAIYQRKRAALDELKKSLLHQAFAGQL